MTGGLVVFMLAFAQTAHALKAPSADDLQYLHERMKAAYDRQAEADAAARLRAAVSALTPARARTAGGRPAA